MIVAIKKLVGFRLIGLLVVLFGCFRVYSRDLGTIGKSYPIIEEDMMIYIQKTLEKNKGKIKEDFETLKKNMNGYGEHTPGINILRAKEYRATMITPVFVLANALTDSEGKILYKAGTEVNPLKYWPLTKVLCFVDGNDKVQIEWMVAHCGTNVRNKLILIQGNFLKLSKKYQKRFYFDQGGFLSKKLGIKAVPAVVRQQGSELYVEEFPL